jgi:hypothetical protein
LEEDMVSIYHEGAPEAPFGYDAAVRTDTLEEDLGRELGRQPLETNHNTGLRQPLRTALTAIRTNLDQRMREWRGSAKVVEQSLRQMAAAEQARAEAIADLERAEADAARAGHAVTQALAGFDESREVPNLDPLFARSQEALDELDRVASELSIAEVWCRSAWKQYAEAVEREHLLRFHIQSNDLNS